MNGAADAWTPPWLGFNGWRLYVDREIFDMRRAVATKPARVIVMASSPKFLAHQGFLRHAGVAWHSAFPFEHLLFRSADR